MLLAALVVLQASGAGIRAQSASRGGELSVVNIRPNFYLIVGAGGNVAVQIGPDGVVVTDTGSAEKADLLLAQIKRLTSAPIRYIINTSADPDHVGGNAKLSLAGQSILPEGYRREGLVGRSFAPILAEEHVLKRMSAPAGKGPPFPLEAWPTSTYSVAIGEVSRKLVMNHDAIRVSYQPAAHTDGDSAVYFQRSDVLVTGDIFDLTRFPVIDKSRGGSIQGVLNSLNRLIDLTFASTPFPYQEDGTRIVPGHGRLCSSSDLVEYRDMLSIVRDRVQDLVSRGRTLEEIQQANPTQGYRRLYGADTGPWTTRMFVEAVHNGLTANDAGKR